MYMEPLLASELEAVLRKISIIGLDSIYKLHLHQSFDSKQRVNMYFTRYLLM